MAASAGSLWKHCNILHERMTKEAESVDGLGLVYRGFLTQLIIGPEPDGLGLPNSFYTPLTQALKRTDAVRQLKRGGGSTPSEWLVLEMPDRELFDWKINSLRFDAKGTRKATKEEITRQAIDALQASVLELRQRVDVLERRS